MLDRYEGGEQAILVHIDFREEGEREDLVEFKMLVSSANVNAISIVTGSRSSPDPKYFVGSGKAEEIAQQVALCEAEVIIFNHALSPGQVRNLEKLCQRRVLDRTTLILDIFAQRARTYEGKLQVELAQLKHLSTRLVRGWTHLERQKGGIGLRGPGETQLECDRRLLRGRIKSILRRLDKVAKQREQGRRSRVRNEIPMVSLVGYTNAGKSTLFNTLTEAGVYAADKLFATLDPTLRRIEVEDVGNTILADTVGFIRHLDHDLVAAFKATLEETREADLLLQVVDCSDERFEDNMRDVEIVLDEIEAGEVPQLIVMNKIDAVEGLAPKIIYNSQGIASHVYLSAKDNLGIDLLFSALSQRLAGAMVTKHLALPPTAGKLRSTLYALNCIEHEVLDDAGGWNIDIRMTMIDWERLLKQQGEVIQTFIAS